MKIAIVTDIHGNSSALRAVLNDIEKNEAEHIYCLGDMVGIGHETNEVLDLLYSRTDVSFVMGNHEEQFVKIAQSRGTENPSEERRHHEWLVSRTDKTFLEKLFQLPRQLSVEHNGKTLLFRHYHLDPRGKFLPIDKNPSGEALDAIYQNVTADVVCFGHHHPVHFFQTKQRIYLNPGSLGCYDKPLARYAIIHIAEQIDVELKEIPYDNRTFLLKYETLDVPAKNFILRAFHGNQHLKFKPF